MIDSKRITLNDLEEAAFRLIDVEFDAFMEMVHTYLDQRGFVNERSSEEGFEGSYKVDGDIVIGRLSVMDGACYFIEDAAAIAMEEEIIRGAKDGTVDIEKFYHLPGWIKPLIRFGRENI